jgi:phosphoribosylformimino-5-aminoimidazole carboxamide ribotide isomerase
MRPLSTIKASNIPHIFPAIDIRGGKAVRLLQGDYDREIDFEKTPVEAGRQWEREGAKWLHVVDLDGALTGRSSNLAYIEELVAAVGVPVQLGGGIRNEEAAKAAFDVGISRIVLGTQAVRDPGFVQEMVGRYGNRIVVSVDARGGKVAVDGWTGVTTVRAGDALRQMESFGVQTAIYTPIEVDGMEQGPQLDELRAAAKASSIRLIYASGVGTLNHVRSIAALRIPNLLGVIVGTALYKGNFKVAEADAALAEEARSLSAA